MTSNIIKIKISEDFTKHPGGRFIKDGDNSGEEFYNDFLKPKFEEILKDPEYKLEINFDGTYGYASSFISEVFRRLVIDFKDKSKIYEKLVFVSNDDPLLEEAIKSIIDETNETDTTE